MHPAQRHRPSRYLATGGYVTREPHPTDRRAILVTLTERGRDAASLMVADYRRSSPRGQLAESTVMVTATASVQLAGPGRRSRVPA